MTLSNRLVRRIAPWGLGRVPAQRVASVRLALIGKSDSPLKCTPSCTLVSRKGEGGDRRPPACMYARVGPPPPGTWREGRPPESGTPPQPEVRARKPNAAYPQRNRPAKSQPPTQPRNLAMPSIVAEAHRFYTGYAIVDPSIPLGWNLYCDSPYLRSL